MYFNHTRKYLRIKYHKRIAFFYFNLLVFIYQHSANSPRNNNKKEIRRFFFVDFDESIFFQANILNSDNS